MKALLKNWLLPIKSICFLYKNKMSAVFILFFVFTTSVKSQVANYVNNGGFEDCLNCDQIFTPTLAKFWGGTDSTKFHGLLLTSDLPTALVPKSSYTYQWPRHGKNFLIGTEYFTTCPNQSCVGYPRNRLKQNLQAGKTYCFKMYVTLSNESSYAIDALAVYFSDNSTDTITQCTLPITYLTPHIQNPTGNIISDTLNWTLISGTYTANGTEKYLMLGNYKTDANTNKTMVNPANLPAKFSSYCYDDISLIDVDLPAYAGPDIFGIPTNTVYIGRPQDVGIDEACMWYHLPNTTTPIDTAAGITITVAATTQTYMVKQDICGNIKWDTVVVHASGVGLEEFKIINERLKVYPQPADENLIVEIENINVEEHYQLKILNNLGQVVKEDKIIIENKTTVLNTKDLPNGVYTLQLFDPIAIGSAQSDRIQKISKKIIINR